jgi:hypothetical protein
MAIRDAMILAVVVAGLLGAPAAPALPPPGDPSGEWTFTGSLAGELRFFPDDAALPGQMEGGQPSLLFEPTLEYESPEGRHQFTFSPFFRLDGRDDERSHFDVRELYWRYVGDGWEVLAGLKETFWGVTESRHLVDVINQRDFVEDIDGEDKLGQPLMSVALQRPWGRLEAILLPGFRERTFPGTAGRLRPPLPVEDDGAFYESRAEDRRLDAALRYSHFLGDWDLGLSLFRGTGREPTLRPDARGEALVPFYSVITQFGVDAQYTRGAWLWKGEGIVREGQGETFEALVAGFEYTLYQVGGTSADLGLLVEYLHDGRDATAPLEPFDDDLFAGARLAFNDTQDTSALVGAVVDRHTGAIAAFVEAERRLGSRLVVALESRLFLDLQATDPSDALAPLAQDSFVTLRLSYFF